jgi:hypothetical protein
MSVSAGTGQGIAVSDQTPGLEIVSLSVSNGTLSIPSLSGASVTTGNQNNSSSITIQGSLTQVNSALASLVYNPSVSAPPYSIDVLTAQVTNSVSMSASGVMDIFITNQLFGGVPQTANLMPLVPAVKSVSSITVVSWDPSVLMQIPTISASGVLSFQAFGTASGGIVYTNVGIKVTYTDGTTSSYILPITIYQPILQVLNGTNTVVNLNAQTSLFEQFVQISNPTLFPIISYSVTATLPSGVILESASGYQSNGSPYVAGITALAPGASVKLLLEYFSPNAQPFPSPQLTLQVAQALTTPTPAGTVAPIQQVVTGYLGRTYVQFQTIAGKTYWMQYRDSSSAAWQTSPSPILGTGQPASWLDYGPPKTSSIPTSTRTYQLLISNP